MLSRQEWMVFQNNKCVLPALSYSSLFILLAFYTQSSGFSCLIYSNMLYQARGVKTLCLCNYLTEHCLSPRCEKTSLITSFTSTQVAKFG